MPQEHREETIERETFIVRVLNTQHGTWQGTVTWTDEKRTESFRSALELLSLMRSSLGEAPLSPQEGDTK